jgi:hypothetical protein
MKRIRVPLSYPAPDDFDGGSISLPGWQLCRGISGSFRVESVATLVWNTQAGETSTEVWGVFETTFLKKEAAEYAKDMRGTWDITSTRATCPDVSASHAITYSDTGITAVGEELNVRNGACVVENINETLSYDDPALAAEFCGPECSYQELNGTYSDEGDTIKLSHKRGSNMINRTKGLDSRQVWVKIK